MAFAHYDDDDICIPRLTCSIAHHDPIWMIAARILLDPSIRERWLEPLVNHRIIDGYVAIEGMWTC